MSFYDEYERIKGLLSSGELRPDQLSNREEVIYRVGGGEYTYDELPPQGKEWIDSTGGPPSFLGEMGHEVGEGWEQMKRGVGQFTGLDASKGEPVTPWSTGLGMMKGAFNIPMGFLRSWGAPATAGTTQALQATGIPDKPYTRLPAEILLGLVQDAGIGTVARAIPRGAIEALPYVNKLLGLGLKDPVKRLNLQTLPETTLAPASSINVVEETMGSVAPDLPVEVAKTLRDKASVLPGLEGRSPYQQAIREMVEETIQRDPSVGEKAEKAIIPLLDRAEKTVEYIKSDEFRAFSSEITDLLRKEGIPDEAIATFLKSQARRELFPGVEIGEAGRASASFIRRIQGLAKTNPRIAELLDLPHKPVLEEQLGLFGREIGAEPTRVERLGKSLEGDVIETGRLMIRPGQLEGRGVQLDWLDEAAKNIIDHPVAPQNVPTTDPGALQKFHNLLRKSLVAMVGSPYTVTRNIVQQALRSGLEIPVGIYQDILSGGSIGEALNRAGNEIGTIFSHKGMSQYIPFLTPEQIEKIRYRGIYGEAITSDMPTFKAIGDPLDWILNKATAANRAQERFFWNKAFSVAMESAKYKQGLMGKMAGELPQSLYDEAFKHAQEMTYSRDIMWKGISEAYNKAMDIPIIGPVLVSDFQPFPRFNWGNALVDALDFAPTGFYKAVLEKDTEQAARVMGKAIVGTRILNYALGETEVPEGNWHDVRIPGVEEKVDVRRWHPFDVPFLMAEAFHRPIGSPNARISMGDVAGVLSGLSRIDDTMVGAFVGMLQQGSTQNFEQHFNTAISNYFSRWTQPLRWGQLAEKAIEPLMRDDPESWKQRDVLTNFTGVMGGIFDRPLSAVPIAGNLLPTRVDPTTSKTPGLKDYSDVLSQLVGLDPVQTNRLKDELVRLKFMGPQGGEFLDLLTDQLDLEKDKMRTGTLDVPLAGDLFRRMYGRQGERDRNRVLNEHMSQLGSGLLDKMMDLPSYKEATDPQRSYQMMKRIDDLKKLFGQVEKAGLPAGKKLDVWLKEQSPFIRRLLDDAAKGR